MKSILLADDLSDNSKTARNRSHAIRDLAAELGRRLKLPLHVIHCNDHQKLDYSASHLKKIKANLRKKRLQLKEEMSHYSVRVKIDSVVGNPVDVILRKLTHSDNELLVLGSQGKTSLFKALLGSVSEEVIRNATRPVVVVGPEAQKREYELSVEDPLRILLLTDLSPASEPAEKYAQSLAKRLNAQLTVCHSLGHTMNELKEAIKLRKLSGLSIVDRRKRIKAEKLLKDKVYTAEKMGIDVESLFLTRDNKLEVDISKDADELYDLIVMGTHSRSKMSTAFLGSSARNLILKSPIPVLIVRSPLK